MGFPGARAKWARDSISQNQLPETMTNIIFLFAGLGTHGDARDDPA